MKNIAEKIGCIGCLAVAAYLYVNGYHNIFVVLLGIFGALGAL